MSYNDYAENVHAQSFLSQDAAYRKVSNALAYQKDVEYMKQSLPIPLQVIQAEIEEECDKLEYAGSVMFDEYPDKNHIRMLADTILHRLSDYEDSEGEVQEASLDEDFYYRPSYCEDDALADCENDMYDEMSIETTEIKQDNRGWGPGHGRDPWEWGSGPGKGPWGPPHKPRHRRPPHRPCWGPFCPIINRPCGRGRWCPPTPFADFDEKGNPNWMKHLVENMLVNEMMFRRSRYRNRNL